MAEVVIPYAPREWAVDFHEHPARWKVLVLHRRAGKTVACLNHLQRDALQLDNARYAYIAPTYKQAKNVAWDLLKYYADCIPGRKFNEAELRVDYPNGSRITLYGADNPDSLRGLGLWGVIFDEYSQQPSNIYTEIIRPALADHEGYAIWIGTPKGHNAFYDLYEYARTNEDDNWLPMLMTVDDTDVIPKEELEDARKSVDQGLITEAEFQQEWYCSFDAAIKGAYYADQIDKARNDGRITTVPYEEAVPVNTYWDLGVGDSTSIIFEQVVGKEHRIIDYYENSGEGLAHYAQVLQQKGYVYGKHHAPHDIQVKELGTGKSRLEMAKALGIRFEIAPNLRIEDGINALRARFNTLWIDKDKCAHLIECLAQYHKEWDDKRGEFKNHPYHDWTSHAADAMRYWAVSKPANAPSGTKVITPQWAGYNRRQVK